MIAWIAAYFSKAVLAGIAGKIWKGFCEFIATPVGAALVAGLLMFVVGRVHEHRVLNAKWEAKWATAEREAEQARVQRDADIKVKMQNIAAARVAALAERKEQLEKMVKDYEDKEKQSPVAAGDLADDSDARWLSDAQRKRAHAKPQARRGLAERLRANRR